MLVKAAEAAAVPLAWGVNLTLNDALWPADRVSGRDSPLTVNSEVVMPAFVTVMLEPLAVSVPVRLLLCPTITLPKFRVAGLTASWPVTVAVPASEMVSVALEASDITEIVPVAPPPVVGANATPKVKLCPALRVMGRDNPVTRKLLTETLAWLMVTLEPPELVRVSDWVPLFPTATLPKLRLGSLLLSTPAVTPAAARGTVRLGLEALLAIERFPLADPPDGGVNVTLKLVLWPAARVAGRFRPLTAKPAPEAPAWLMVTLVPPELVSVSDSV